MNTKAKIATVIAVLLGLFLVIITAIKFDWVGKISRGEQIIKFHSEEKESIKKEESTDESDDNQEDDSNSDNEITVSCLKNTVENNINMNTQVQLYFENDVIHSTSSSIDLSYSIAETKSAFDTLVANYNNLYTKYNSINGITVTVDQKTTSYKYTQLVFYDELNEADLTTNGLQPLYPTKTDTLESIMQYYTTQGYTCTQH